MSDNKNKPSPNPIKEDRTSKEVEEGNGEVEDKIKVMDHSEDKIREDIIELITRKLPH